jgi:GTPase
MIRKKKLSKRIEIDLTGPQGNAFYILGIAQQLGKATGMEENEIKDLITRMMSGDYENLIKNFDNQFGSFVILYR